MGEMPREVSDAVQVLRRAAGSHARTDGVFAGEAAALLTWLDAEPARVAAAVAADRARCAKIARRYATEYGDNAMYGVYHEGASECAEEIADAIEGADAVTTATPAPEPVVCGKPLAGPGMTPMAWCSRTDPCSRSSCAHPTATPAPAPVFHYSNTGMPATTPREPDEAGERARATHAVVAAARQFVYARYAIAASPLAPDPGAVYERAATLKGDAWDELHRAVWKLDDLEGGRDDAAVASMPDADALCVARGEMQWMARNPEQCIARSCLSVRQVTALVQMLDDARARAAAAVPECVRSVVRGSADYLRSMSQHPMESPGVRASYRADADALDAWLAATAPQAGEGHRG